MDWLQISALYTAREQDRYSNSRKPADQGWGWWITVGGIALVVARLLF